MTHKSLGVAVIGAGMVGRAHAAGYRVATQLYDLDLPEVRLVAVADAHEPFAVDAAKRFGYERAETSWQAIVDAADIDVVSVAIANELHRPGRRGAARGRQARAVREAAGPLGRGRQGDGRRRRGRRHPVRRRVLLPADARRSTPSASSSRPARSAPLRHFNGHYWCDYAQNPDNPMSWRYKGGPGTGALADIGSHMIDLGEYLCGPITSVSGAVFQTFTTERPVALGATVGHAAGGGRRPNGAGRQRGHRHLHRAVRQRRRRHVLDQPHLARPAQRARLRGLRGRRRGGLRPQPSRRVHLRRPWPGREDQRDRTVLIGPQHPGIDKGIAMDFPSVGHGQNDLFAWQARAFLDQVAGLGNLAPLPSLTAGPSQHGDPGRSHPVGAQRRPGRQPSTDTCTSRRLSKPSSSRKEHP